MTSLPQHIQRLVWVMQKGRPTRVVSLALLAALLVSQSPSAWSQPSTPAESTRAAQSVPGFEPLTVTGVLDENSDTLEDNSYFNTHTFEGVAGQSIVIELTSDEFDTYLLLLDTNNNRIADNDDAKGTNSRIVIVLPETGTYTILANSYGAGQVGIYSLYLRIATLEEIEQQAVLEEAERLNQQVVQLTQEGRYSEAIPLAQQALESREAVLGMTHIDIATSLNNLATLYSYQSDYDAAESLYQRALSIVETILGESAPLVATIFNDLALLHIYQGNYSDAESFALRSLSIREVALGETHHDFATSLNTLAILYREQGKYDAAESLYRRSLSIREAALDEMHPDIANSLSNLAELYTAQGNYSAAEPLYQQAIFIQEMVLGETHPHLAINLNNLASLYLLQGNYSDAESLALRSLSIREMTLGDTHPHVALSLSNLALIHSYQGNYSKAETFVLRSLSILERSIGESHPHTALIVSSLAQLYYIQGNYGVAESLYRRAISIREAVLDEEHPDVADGLHNLAQLHQAQGDYKAAEPLYQQALLVYERSLGETHPDVAIVLANLATLYQSLGYLNQSFAFLASGVAVEEANLALNLAIGSETRKRAYITTISGTTYFTISLHLQNTANNSDAARLALTTVLRRKGRVLDAVTDTQQLLRQNLSPDLVPLLDEYTAAQTQLAAQLYGGLGDQDPNVYRDRIDDLRQEVNRLENELSRRSAEFRVETEPVEIESVQALIPVDAALVELVQYRPFNPAASQSERWGQHRYAAYILHNSGDPRWVDLGDAETIDTAARAFLAATRTPNSLTQARTTARALDELVMAPIRPLLGEATHLLLSPDSQLNLVPFAALLDEQDRYLAQTHTLTHLTTGRDLLRLQNPAPSQQPPVLFANPNYDTADASGAQLVAAASTPPRPQGEGSGVRGDQRSGDIADLRFGPLPGTQQEVDAIVPLLPNPILLTEANATENALKQVQAPSILHIATHGFFLEDVEFVPPPGAARGDRAGIDIVYTGEAPPPTRPVSNENPLLRSGLALAGFNSRTSAGEDGVLTALEATGLNLRGTRLVVMSACETGVGQVANGEGVYGLRRAFVMAGAESQLMSLWKVDDFGTAELMQRYYQRLQNGEGRSEALRQVQLEFIEAPAYQHPYYWASFLFSGQWSPMNNP